MKSKKIPILMYHSIQKESRRNILRGLSVSPMLFFIQMLVLKILGYRGLSMSMLQPYISKKKEGKVFGITFDDGYKNNYFSALPILKKFGFTATCYVVSGNIGGVNFWDINKGVSKKQMMNKSEIKDWINQGMEIGCHSFSHTKLSLCNPKELKKEIILSKQILEKEFDIKIKHFCYPYGDKSSRVEDLIRKSGYETATTVARGRVSSENDYLDLPRVLINHRTYPHLLLLKLFSS